MPIIPLGEVVPTDTSINTTWEYQLYLAFTMEGSRSGFRAVLLKVVFALCRNESSQALPIRPTQSASPVGGTPVIWVFRSSSHDPYVKKFENHPFRAQEIELWMVWPSNTRFPNHPNWCSFSITCPEAGLVVNSSTEMYRSFKCYKLRFVATLARKWTPELGWAK